MNETCVSFLKLDNSNIVDDFFHLLAGVLSFYAQSSFKNRGNLGLRRGSLKYFFNIFWSKLNFLNFFSMTYLLLTNHTNLQEFLILQSDKPQKRTLHWPAAITNRMIKSLQQVRISKFFFTLQTRWPVRFKNWCWFFDKINLEFKKIQKS